ncbi:hypothetical protein D4764_0192110, partial [Takifugu flavidus]
ALIVTRRVISPGLVRAAWPRTRRHWSRRWRRKRGECVRDSEVSGGSEIVEMVVEMNDESGEARGKVDLTGLVVDVSCVMSDVTCDSNELGENGEVMGETVKLGEAGETGNLIQTGEQVRVSQVIGEHGVPETAAGKQGEGEGGIVEQGEGAVSTGERGEGGVSTGERGEGGVSTGERGEGGVSTGEHGEGIVSTGERGEEAVSAGEGTSGAPEWWLVPAKRRNKRKSAMKDKGGKTVRLEDTAADTDTSDCESMSDGSELSGTMPEGRKLTCTLQACLKSSLPRQRA